MKLNKVLSLGVCAALCAAVLAGCGSSGAASSAASKAASSAAASTAASAASSAAGSTAASTDLASVQAAVLQSNPISNPFTIADFNIQNDYLLDASLIESYSGVRSNDAGDAGLVLVIQAKSGQGDAVAAALKSYQDGQVTYLSNYADQATAKENMQNAVISVNGDLVVMAAASNECTDAAGLSAAVDKALGK